MSEEADGTFHEPVAVHALVFGFVEPKLFASWILIFSNVEILQERCDWREPLNKMRHRWRFDDVGVEARKKFIFNNHSPIFS